MADFFTLWLLYKGIKALLDDTSGKIGKSSTEISSVTNNAHTSNEGQFNKLTELHHSSVLLANEAYRRKVELNDFIQKLIEAINEKRKLNDDTFLKTKSTRGQEREELYELMKKRNAEIKEHNEKIEQVKTEKNEFLEKVKKYNKETQTLKFLIRDTCGKGGKMWFEKLESKKSLNQ